MKGGDPNTTAHRSPFLQGIVPVDRSRVTIEIVAGITLAALAIPEVMGYTAIAGMPVITGLYTILVPIAVFALLGSSRHLVVGADSATAAVLAAGLAGMAATGSDQYVALASMVALLAALFLFLARVIKLGFIADFLSRTVLVGFLSGVGVQVALGQVGGVLGIPDGTGITIDGHEFTGSIAKFLDTLSGIADISWTTTAVSAAVIVTILGAKYVTKKIPGALIAVLGAIFFSWALDLVDHGVTILGKVPGGLPDFGFPDVTWSETVSLLGTAGSIFILILAQSAATSRAYAARYNDRFDENVDLVGLGGANVAAGLSATFCVNGSPTKTQMVDNAGGRTQIAQLTTGFVVLIVLLFLTKPLQYLPNAVLSSVVLLIGIELVDVAGLRKIWRTAPDEFVVAALTGLTVIVIGVEQAILLAIIASVIAHLRRSYRPSTTVLARTDGSWRWVDHDPAARSLPGLVAYRFAGSLYYANANHLFEEVASFAEAEADPPLRWVCLDASAIAGVDFTAGQTLIQLQGDLDAHGVRLVMCEVSSDVRAGLDRLGVTQVVGDDGFFDTINEAVKAFRGSTPTAGR